MVLKPQSLSRLGLLQCRSFGAGHGPDMPPFARSRPPTEMLHEEIELVWDDTVAPETCVDFDAPHVSTRDVLLSFLAGFGFFGLIYLLVAYSDPVGSNPVATRAAIINDAEYRSYMGLSSGTDEEEEEEDE
jgi:hypothetical protein